MRKEKTITIEREGRDNGKIFRITEMSALKQENWAARLVAALINSGVSLPSVENIGDLAQFISKNGLSSISGLKLDLIMPLYTELLDCIEYLGVRGDRNKISRPLSNETADEVIDEVTTLFYLRSEVLKLHFDFLEVGGNLT